MEGYKTVSIRNRVHRKLMKLARDKEKSLKGTRRVSMAEIIGDLLSENPLAIVYERE